MTKKQILRKPDKRQDRGMTRPMISPFLRFFPGPSGGLGQNDEEGFTHMPIYGARLRMKENGYFVSDK